MPEAIAVHNIAYREKRGAPRKVITAGSRFRTEDIKGISNAEWEAMAKAEHPSIRPPDDPRYITPQPVPEVAEGSSPRTDLAAQQEAPAARAAADDDDDDDDDDSGDGETQATKPAGRRGRRRATVADDDDI